MNTAITASIILVEDDLRLSELVSRYLENNGFRVTITNGGDQVVSQVLRDVPDLVILDLGLPGQDGLSICRQLRPAYRNPILILTARDNDIDHVLGLELGADGESIALSSAEFDLLVCLAAHAGEIQSREALFQQLYKREYDGIDRMLDVRISHLRRKLGDEADNSKRIKTIWGQGYLFVPDEW